MSHWAWGVCWAAMIVGFIAGCAWGGMVQRKRGYDDGYMDGVHATRSRRD